MLIMKYMMLILIFFFDLIFSTAQPSPPHCLWGGIEKQLWLVGPGAQSIEAAIIIESDMITTDEVEEENYDDDDNIP